MLRICNSFNKIVTIFTDSKSTIQKINRMYSIHPIISKIQSWLIRLKSKYKQVEFLVILIKRNEHTDKLSKYISIADTQPV